MGIDGNRRLPPTCATSFFWLLEIKTGNYKTPDLLEILQTPTQIHLLSPVCGPSTLQFKLSGEQGQSEIQDGLKSDIRKDKEDSE